MKEKILISLYLLLTTTTLANISLSDRKEATKYTIEKNRKQKEELNFSNTQDFSDAKRGFIAKWPEKTIKDEKGNVIWNFEQWNFLKKYNLNNIPNTINPSLWRQAYLNSISGLFEVTPGIYQIRGFDLANITFVKGKTGWIVIDTATSKEIAQASYELIKKHVKKLPIKAVIFTHSHVDHFGGVKGLVSQEEVDKNKIQIVAPKNFFEEAVSENLITGNAMSRRASYMYGSTLPKDEKGTVDAGLGKGVSVGEITILKPTHTINKTGDKLTIDGVDFEFIMANGTEAPSEFVFYLPQYKALGGAEVLNRTLHNISTLRGAKTRDTLKWAKTIDEIKKLYGTKAEIMFTSHHWPLWGQKNIEMFLEKYRDTYKFIHDQTLRLANQGYNPSQIAEKIKLPKSLNTEDIMEQKIIT